MWVLERDDHQQFVGGDIFSSAPRRSVASDGNVAMPVWTCAVVLLERQRIRHGIRAIELGLYEICFTEETV